ncbi:MAG: hypothetical protein QOE56_425 [Solirubrobacterales bacterium]|jgi:hypothetical protein|nr:hypothetical protein [Solirubrobacterales bacterium]
MQGPPLRRGVGFSPALLLLGFQRNRGLTIYRLDPDGNRDRTIGGRRGQRLGVLREMTFRGVVSIWKDRPLIYFDDSSSSCDSPQSWKLIPRYLDFALECPRAQFGELNRLPGE